MNVEIIDFYRPDASRKNLYITNIPQTITESDIVVSIFQAVYGPLCFLTTPTEILNISDKKNKYIYDIIWPLPLYK